MLVFLGDDECWFGSELMGSIRRRKCGWCAIFLLLLSSLCSWVVHGSENSTAEAAFDAFLDDLAFEAPAQRRPHTGALYKADVPASLAGMQISFVRLRAKTLWNIGANFNNVRIPSRTLPTPHVKRLFIVYQDLGNWSDHYYNVTGYSLVTSVVSFMAYDASNLNSSNVTKLHLNTMGDPISIHFPNLTFPESTIPQPKCVTFDASGRVSFSDMSSTSVCYSTRPGHFSIVAPARMMRKQRVWNLWVIGFAVGCLGLILVGFSGIVFLRYLEAKRIHGMERETDQGVVLETTWIGHSKMPSANVTRTHPVLENAVLP